MSLLILGVGHVFRIAAPIQDIIANERPEVVALELDTARYRGLLEREAGTYDAAGAEKQATRAYRRLARFQEDLAASLGVDVGGEMLAAAHAARDAGSKIALIDRNAQDVVGRVWKEMGFRERVRLAFSAVVARFKFRKSGTVEQEIARYQNDPGRYLDELGREYPTLKRVLIDERNEHMAKNLRALLKNHPHVVAVVGDGHVDGLVGLLTDLSPRTVRLAELRKAPLRRGGALSWRFGKKGEAVGFSFDQQSPEGSLHYPW